MAKLGQGAAGTDAPAGEFAEALKCETLAVPDFPGQQCFDTDHGTQLRHDHAGRKHAAKLFRQLGGESGRGCGFAYDPARARA